MMRVRLGSVQSFSEHDCSRRSCIHSAGDNCCCFPPLRFSIPRGPSVRCKRYIRRAPQSSRHSADGRFYLFSWVDSYVSYFFSVSASCGKQACPSLAEYRDWSSRTRRLRNLCSCRQSISGKAVVGRFPFYPGIFVHTRRLPGASPIQTHGLSHSNVCCIALYVTIVKRARSPLRFAFDYRSWYLAAAVLWIYITQIFGNLPPKWGGGKPTPILIFQHSPAPWSPSNPTDALLLDETDQGFYVLLC